MPSKMKQSSFRQDGATSPAAFRGSPANGNAPNGDVERKAPSAEEGQVAADSAEGKTAIAPKEDDGGGKVAATDSDLPSLSVVEVNIRRRNVGGRTEATSPLAGDEEEEASSRKDT